eukprot:TRINITY_DN4875_c0_g1_i1.p2 TRINITY_DN4875_c0_g1~~TRINITY_DN4875_c0_g1_i1.p2  ORF type:complete len:316 (-),score=35.94 TRINITY_DN4875_c0_g1_i1:214-1047(-)
MADAQESIKTMKLYTHVDRVYAELKELNIGPDDKVDAETLSTIDSMHYLGNQAMDNAIQIAEIKSSDKVLDVGSGLGGPARMVATKTGCQVDALELQNDLHTTAVDFTKKSGLEDKVSHFCGDILDFEIKESEYDVIVSWLVFLHIPDRKKLLDVCFKTLKPGGRLYVEDFFSRNEFTQAEKEMLEKDVYISYLPTLQELEKQLGDAGFESVSIVDMTDKWTEFVSTRFNTFKEQYDRHVRVHGEDATASLRHFYNSIYTLFTGGNLGGVVFSAKKP